MLDETVTTPFEIDHFIPKAVFREKRIDLETEYTNLVYSCKKCNNAKRQQFSGNIDARNPTNELFYDPVLTDYNTIFYRNEIGAIDSNDDKGKKSITLLKLYRPIHILAWICEELNDTAERLEAAVNAELDGPRKQTLERALNKINNQYRKLSRLFTAAYNDNTFSVSSIEEVASEAFSAPR